MNKLRIAILATVVMGVTQAEYTVKYPLTHIPAGSIQLVKPQAPAGNWVAADPIYTEWLIVGDVYNCKSTPEIYQVLKGKVFIQTTLCKQDEERTKQNREQETTTLKYRNVGEAITEKVVTPTNSSKQEIGTAAGKEVTTCSFSYNKNGTHVLDHYWQNGTSNNDFYEIKANGVLLINEKGYNKTSINIDGIEYRKGILKSSVPNIIYNELCITKIE